MSIQSNVLPIRPIQGISTPLTVIVAETIDSGVASLVNYIKVPNLLLTTINEYSTLHITESRNETYLSIDITRVSPEEIKLMIDKCNPTQIAIHNLDVMFERDYKRTTWLSLSRHARDFISHLQDITRTAITLIGTSQTTMVDLR